MTRAVRRLPARLLARGVPSGPVFRQAGRRVRLLALLAFRDEEASLPGYLRNVAPHVDGIIALDDGSSDSGPALVEAHPSVIELLRVPPERPSWDEVGNFKTLVQAAARHDADWALVLDADERVERDFRERAERVIARGGHLGITAFAVRMRELWGAPDTWRADGVWGEKGPARLFAVRDDHEFDERALHATKAPLQAVRDGSVARADLEVYHLRMIRPEDRRARRERYESLDPSARWQPREGYAYLTDETGLELRPVPRRRGYLD